MRTLLFIVATSAFMVIASCSRAPVTEVANDMPPLYQRTTDQSDNGSPEAELAAAETKPSDITTDPRIELIEPQKWVELHHVATKPQSKGWREALETLQRVGDGFSVELLRKLKLDELSDADRELLAGTLAKIEERVGPEDEQASAALVLPRLERAAYADLTCDPLETKLLRWTLNKIGTQVDQRRVRARLEDLRTNYAPTTATETMFSSMSERVPTYVARLLNRSVSEAGERPN